MWNIEKKKIGTKLYDFYNGHGCIELYVLIMFNSKFHTSCREKKNLNDGLRIIRIECRLLIEYCVKIKKKLNKLVISKINVKQIG